MPFDFAAPIFRIEVGGTTLRDDVNALISSISYETDVDLASKLKIMCENPDGIISDSKMFQPGNEIDLYLGYGSQLAYMGRVEIVKVRPKFGAKQDALTMEVIGYDKSWRLMEEKSDGEVFAGMTHSQIVQEIASRSKMISDVTTTTAVESKFTKQGQSHHSILRGLANAHNFEYYVEFVPSDTARPGNELADGSWTVVWQHFDEIGQEFRYKFEYGITDSSVLSWKPEFAFTKAQTAIKVIGWDKTGEKKVVVQHPTDIDLAEIDALEDLRFLDAQPVQEELVDLNRVLIALDKHSIEIETGIPIEDEKQAQDYAEAWFERNKNAFIHGKGSVVGIPHLKARQVHEFEGFGIQYDGDWQLTKVKHTIDRSADLPYITNISARKVIK